MHRNPERLAWTVLVVSLLICIGLTIAVPVSVSHFINNTTEVAAITLETWAGVPLVYPPGQDIPSGVTVTSSLDNLLERSKINTDQNTQALLAIRARRNGPTLLTVQIYGSAELVIEEAQSPRYSQSVQPYRVHLSLIRGQVRVTVAGNNDLDRALDAQLVAPVVTATAALEAGDYSFDVSGNALDLKVRAGKAAVQGEQGPILILNSSQRTRVLAGDAPDVALPPEQNLIANGDFRQPLSNTWEVTGTVDAATSG